MKIAKGEKRILGWHIMPFKNSKQHVPHILWCRPPVTGAKQIFSGFVFMMMVAGFWGQLIAPLQHSENMPSQQGLSFTIQSPEDISSDKILCFTQKICFTIEIWSSVRWRPWNSIPSNEVHKVIERNVNPVGFFLDISLDKVYFLKDFFDTIGIVRNTK